MEMDTIEIAVNGTSAVTVSAVTIICGNTGYKAHFTFSDEWGAYTAKTAVFTFFSMRTGKTNQYEVLFEGETAEIPVVTNTVSLTIGVIAGDVKTTTDANVPCMNSNTSSVLLHDNPPPDIYEQLLEYLKNLLSAGMTGQMVAILGGTPPSPVGIAEQI